MGDWPEFRVCVVASRYAYGFGSPKDVRLSPSESTSTHIASSVTLTVNRRSAFTNASPYWSWNTRPVGPPPGPWFTALPWAKRTAVCHALSPVIVPTRVHVSPLDVFSSTLPPDSALYVTYPIIEPVGHGRFR